MMAVPLLELQRAWLSALRDPAPGPALDTLLSRLEGGQRNAEEGFAVYANNVRATLIQALRISFPTTEALMGRGLFCRAVLHCLKHFPPQQGNLDEYGQEFAASVQAVLETTQQGNQEETVQVAKCEWTLDCLGRAPETPALTFHELKTVPQPLWPQLRFVLTGKTALVGPEGAFLEVIAKHARSRFQVSVNAPKSDAIDTVAPGHWLVVVVDRQASAYPLSPVAGGWLELIVSGYSLEAATHSVLQSYPEFDLLPLLLWLIEVQALRFELTRREQ